MKRKAFLALLAIAALAVSGCNRQEVTELQATEAFAIGFGSYMAVAMSAAFGQAPDGVTLDQEKGTITFSDYDLSALGMESDYTTLSGTVTASESEMTMDLKLEGGVVETLEFTMSDLEADQITVKVNGREMTIDPAAAAVPE